MKIIIPGGSGYVGTLLARAFHESGDEVVVLSRAPANKPCAKSHGSRSPRLRRILAFNPSRSVSGSLALVARSTQRRNIAAAALKHATDWQRAPSLNAARMSTGRCSGGSIGAESLMLMKLSTLTRWPAAPENFARPPLLMMSLLCTSLSDNTKTVDRRQCRQTQKASYHCCQAY